jgi:hypothetical protein
VGSIGAAVGSALGACLVSLPWNLTAIARDTGVRPLDMLRLSLGGWAWRFGLLSAALFALTMRWSPQTLLQSIVAIVIISLAYSALMLPRLLNSPVGEYIQSIVSSVRSKYVPQEIGVS